MMSRFRTLALLFIALSCFVYWSHRAPQAHRDLGPLDQQQFHREHEILGSKPNAGKIFGNTLDDLIEPGQHAGVAAAVPHVHQSPQIHSPYPEYNRPAWKTKNQGTYEPCDGAHGAIVGVRAFPGHLKSFENPPIGSFAIFGIDSNLCYERDTRLGPYGLIDEDEKSGKSDDLRDTSVTLSGSLQKQKEWDSVNWGTLQDVCYRKNQNRFAELPAQTLATEQRTNATKGGISSRSRIISSLGDLTAKFTDLSKPTQPGDLRPKVQSRTAILLRAFTGKVWSENDKQVLRSMITELALGSGGEYEVFILMQVKDESIPIWTSSEQYDNVVESNVPKEFRDITVLWNDDLIRATYPDMEQDHISVHQAQWLCVQKFAQDYSQFTHFWNWELDARAIGHHYDLLDKMSSFAAAQPRKYLWERNERYYIPSVHGSFDGKFRRQVADLSGNETVWGPVPATNVTPSGPVPPVSSPDKDNYKWGVGEDADYITLAPMFNPVNTNWIGRDDVWGYEDGPDLPRRTTIITHSRSSKRLLNAMHAESLRGKHVSSEMTPQTVALLHGLKAVYAPLPIYFDREWEGRSIEKWFNPGTKGDSGGPESPFGWFREGRFLGSTWYYRTVATERLYNNWLGWEDTAIGGPEWEKQNGRPCLPPMMLHPIKNTVKSPPGYVSKTELPYDSPI